MAFVPWFGVPNGAGLAGRGAFKVSLSSSPVLVAGVTTKVPFDTIVTDRDGWFDNVTNFRYNPKIAGDYQFSCSYRSSALAVGNHNWIAFIFINDISGPETFTRSGQSGDLNVTLTSQIFLNGDDDFIDFRVNTSSGPGVTINTSPNITWAEGFLIRPA